MSVLTATRTPNDFSVSGWYAVLPDAGPAEEIEDDITADWIVIGGGFAGLAAARRFTQLRGGERIVLLDAQRIGQGSAGRNSGFMIDLPHEMQSDNYAGGRDADLKQIRINRAGIGYMRAAVEEYGLGAFFNPCGKYHGATNGRGLTALHSFAAHLDDLGETYTRLDARGMKDLTGTAYWTGGLHTPGAAVIQPAAIVRGVANGLRGRVRVFENSPVTVIERGADIVVKTPKGSVRAPKAIITVNGQLESFGLFRRQLLHVFTYASMTRPMTEDETRALGGRDEWALIPADPMGTTVRRTRDGRITVRNTFTYNPSMSTSEAEIAKISANHDRSFRARFPMLANMDMEYRWGGHLCLSLNSVPVFGEIERGLYAACCHNGLGTVKGTINGKLAADLAAGSNDPMIDDLLAYDAPTRLYPEPFMTLGAKARLWWDQRRAGSDF